MKHTRISAGRKGGNKTKATHGHDHFVKIGRKGGQSRKRSRKAK